MGTTEKIKILMIRRNITQKDLAQRLKCSQANLSKKFKLDDWRESDLREIAAVCNCKYESFFVLGEDEKI